MTMDRQLHHRRPDGRDRGRISVFVAAVMPVMLLFIALMWDASGYLRALHRADNIANEAARAAGQAINIPLAVSGQGIVVDPAAAEQAAAAYLADAGVTGQVWVSEDGRQVGVTVVVPYEPMFLGAFGFGNFTAEGEANAHLVDE
ncbi:MAG TPA: pilus assembly protein TadG-related protein [Natronosporangium sp.]|nr:pilus assembly protein TadG-related protein [Natronosporangium sp.]